MVTKGGKKTHLKHPARRQPPRVFYVTNSIIRADSSMALFLAVDSMLLFCADPANRERKDCPISRSSLEGRGKEARVGDAHTGENPRIPLDPNGLVGTSTTCSIPGW